MWRDRFLEVRVLPLPPFAINKKHLFRPRSGRVLCRPRSLPNRNMTGALVFWATASLERRQASDIRTNLQQICKEDCFLAMRKFWACLPEKTG